MIYPTAEDAIAAITEKLGAGATLADGAAVWTAMRKAGQVSYEFGEKVGYYLHDDLDVFQFVED